MGIEMIEGPRHEVDARAAGRFTLPVGFNHKKWAPQWVKDSNVSHMTGRQYLQGIPATADGWTPYTGEDKTRREKIREVSVEEGGKTVKYVLMVRPREVQDAVNAIYGNLGKERAAQEQNGESVAGAALQDPGMLPINRMRKLGLDDGEVERSESQFRMNPVHISGSHADASRSV
jgi:hypothetical protein